MHEEQTNETGGVQDPDKRLREMLGLYDELLEEDNTRLRDRLYRSLVIKPGLLRRRRALLGMCAAVILPMLILGGGYFFFNRTGTGPEEWIPDAVEVTLSDGTVVKLDGEAAVSGIAVDGGLVFDPEEGTLTVSSKEGEAGLDKTGMRAVYVPRGRQFNIKLEDGTRVWINSDSRLTFPAVFGGNERRVSLEGEAYFSVDRDVERPFVVRSGGQTLTVLGTEFNIYAYASEGTVLTTLVSGSVSVAGESGQEIKLEPGQRSEYDTNSQAITITQVNAHEISAWKEGIFAFDENTLEQVMMKLERRYNIQVDFAEESLKGILFKGTLPMYDDVIRVLNFIEKSGTVAFDRNGDKITVRK